MPSATAIRVDARHITTADVDVDAAVGPIDDRPASRVTALRPLTPLTPLRSPDVGTSVVADDTGRTAKRVLDVTISLIALLLLAPVILLVALAVKVTGPGPVLFRQERVGQDGRTFHLVKFRSMRVGTDLELMVDELAHRRYVKNGFKLAADDPRITTVGRFIRRTSLDELPQLVNVLRGDMSLVGIRPLLAEELACRLEYDQACYRAMKPGMTGLWQVSGRSSVEAEDRHELDRRYVETWSAWNDVKVLLRTPLAVLNVANTR